MPVTKEIRETIRKYAIKNAIDYGKAEVGSVLGKAISNAKGVPVPELKKEVEAAVKEVNKLKKAELEKEYKPFEKEFEKRAEETAKKTEKPNLAIDGAEKGKVVTRISPGPNGYMHIGHVKQALLSEEVSKLYDGKFYRYFDDTDPEKCKQEYVDAMMADHKWLGLKFEKTYYASDFVDKMYGYAKEMIGKRKAYVCTCDREVMKKKRFDGEECVHRTQTEKGNARLFEDMISGKFKEGDATLRFKGDMKAQNTILRDPVMLRIVETPHYRVGTKYRVWPVYDFNTPIVDSLQGVTDIIRSKEYELHDELSDQILRVLELRVPRMHLEARLNIKGNITQKRDIRTLIDEGKLQGWDDPRLMTIMALKRRGITPEAIRSFILRLGMTKTDSTVPLDMLLAENKKVIDPIAKHLFFVGKPVEIKVDGAGVVDAKLRLHPGNDYGFREYSTNGTFYIDGGDAKELHKDEILSIRLKDLMDIQLKSSGGKVFKAEKVADSPKGKIIQWVPEKDKIKCTVLVPGPILDDKGNFNPDSMETISGYVESYAEKLKEHEIVQFERFGYCILDDKKKMQFIFISK